MSNTAKYKLFGADANPNLSNNKFVGKVESLPYANSKLYIDHLIALCKKHQINVIFHGSEPELLVLAKNKERFEELGILLAINNTDLIQKALNKAEFSRVLSMKGFDVPAWWLVNSSNELSSVDRYPVVVKPYLGGGGSRDVFIAQTPEELQSVAVLLKSKIQHGKLFIQEYVGNYKDEYTVGILNRPDGSLVGSIAMKRDLSSTLSVKSKVINVSGDLSLGDYLVISSGISQGMIQGYPEVRSQCEKIANELKSTGPLNIQCRFINGKVVIFEVNPRFSGTTYCRALAGFNEPDLWLNAHFASGAQRSVPEFRSGIISRSLTEHFYPLPE